jgi:tetratricopeptide (TPR) repeat protein
MRRALAIDEASYGAEHPRVAIDRPQQPGEQLMLQRPPTACCFQATNRLEAEPLMRRALAIDEASYGAEHPADLNNLAQLLQDTNRLAEAEPLMRRALAIDEASYGAEHPDVAIDLNNLAQLLKATNRLSEAEPLMRRALAIDEASYGAEHPNVAIASTTWPSCSRPPTAWRRPSR